MLSLNLRTYVCVPWACFQLQQCLTWHRRWWSRRRVAQHSNMPQSAAHPPKNAESANMGHHRIKNVVCMVPFQSFRPEAVHIAAWSSFACCPPTPDMEIVSIETFVVTNLKRRHSSLASYVVLRRPLRLRWWPMIWGGAYGLWCLGGLYIHVIVRTWQGN